MYVGKIVQWLERIFKPGSSPLDVLFVVATAPRKNGVIDPTTWKASMEALHLQAADHPCVYDGHGRRLMNKTGQHLLYAAKEHMSQALMHLDPSNNAAVHGKRMTDMFRYAANVTMRGLAKNVPTYKLPKDEVIGGHGHFSEDDHHICRFLESTNLLSLLEHPLRDKACDLAHHLIDHYNMDQPSRYFVDSAADSKIIDLLWSLAHAKALYHSVAHLHLELHGDSQHLNSEDYNYRLTQEKNLQDVERLFEEWRGGQPHAELPAGITAAELDTRAT